MSPVVIENLILNSPAERAEPTRHFRFTDKGITDDTDEGRRISQYFVPIPLPRKNGQQMAFTKWKQDRVEENHFINRVPERDVLAAKTRPAKRWAIRNQAIVTVLLHTSLRVSELCDLEMGDLKITERKGTLRVRQGKGNKQRDIPLNAVARAAFQDWFAVRASLPPRAAGRNKAVPNVFTGRDGNPLTSSGVERMLSHLARRADVEVTPHTLRHTFAKNLVNSGVSLEKVAALMGHSNLNTSSIYTIPSALDLEHAVAQIDE